MRFDLGHHLLGGITPRMPRPRHAPLGQQDVDHRIGAGIALDQRDRIDIAIGREPGAIAVGIGHRRRQRHPPHPRRDPLQPRHAQRQQIATLLGGEGVDLVDDDRLELGEHREAVGIAEQQRQRFGRGQQNLRRLGPLPRLAVARRIPGARLDPDVEPHLVDRRNQVALHVHRQRLERRHVKRVQPLTRRLDQFGERRQKPRKRLPRPRRRDKQRMPPLTRLGEHGKLMPPRRPLARREPVGQLFG